MQGIHEHDLLGEQDLLRTMERDRPEGSTLQPTSIKTTTNGVLLPVDPTDSHVPGLYGVCALPYLAVPQ